MKTYLKVKLKSLASEARIIRHEEQRCKRWWRASSTRQGEEARVEALHTEYHGLREHRRGVVRAEARASHLAYAYIRGKPYAKTEPADRNGVHPGLPLTKVAALAARFGGKPTTPDEIKAWTEAQLA